MADIIGAWDGTVGVAEFYAPITIAGTEHDDGVMFRFSDFETTRDNNLRATVAVNWNLTPHQGFVKEGQLILGRGTATWARDLSKLRGELAEGVWAQILERVTRMARSYFERGEPFTIMGQAEPPPMQYLLRPMVAASGGSVFAAAGGTGKSMLALAIALSVATGRRDVLGFNPKRVGPVLYIDYEESGSTVDAVAAHDERLFALCRGLGIKPPANLYYSRERMPLHMSVKSLNMKIREMDEYPVLAIIDSIGKALGGDPNSAADTIRFYNAADQLRMPWVGIHHKSKAAIEYGKKGPTGSQYATDLARTVWDIESVQLAGHDRIQLVAHNSKVNRTRKQPSQAWEVEFTNDDTAGKERLVEVTYRSVPITGVRRLSFNETSTVEAIEAAMKDSNEPLSVSELAEVTGKSEATVRKALSRDSDMFMKAGRVPTTGATLWGLADRDDQMELPDNIVG